jgi:hypothetical protein
MTAGDEDLIRSVWSMVDANEAYQAALASNAALMRESAVRLENGEDLLDVVRTAPGGAGRDRVQRAEKVLTDARIRFRVQLVAACMSAGMSRQEIASNMGFSPQLVSRFRKAADNRDGTIRPPSTRS